MSAARSESDLEFALRWAWLALGVAAFVQFSWVATPVLFFHGGDNAHYWLLGDALVSGHGFSDVLVEPAGPHTKYPPLFPLYLAGVMAVFGANVFAAKVGIALFGVAMVCGTALLWQGRGPRGVALLSAAWVATVPVTTTYAMLLLSELPFAALTVLTLLFAERAIEKGSVEGRGMGWEAWLAGGCLAMAALTRSAGVVLIPAVVLAALLAARRAGSLREGAGLAAALGLPGFLALALWSLRGRLVTGGERHTYVREFFLRDLRDVDSGWIGVGDLLSRIGEGSVYYLEQLGRLLWSLPGGSPDAAVWLGATFFAFAAAGLARCVRLGGWRTPELFSVLYLALIVVWHENEERFLVALFPTFLFYVVFRLEAGLRWAGQKLGPRGARLATILGSCIVVAFVGFNLAANARTIAQAEYAKRELGLDLSPRFRIVAMNGPSSRMLALAAWLRKEAEPDALVLARKPRLVALASDRRALGGPWDADPAGFVAMLERAGVDYVLVDEIHAETRAYVARMLEAFPERFTLVYQVDQSDSRLYRFNPAR